MPDSRERDSFVGRVAPTYHATDDLALTVGLSGQRFRADFGSPTRDDGVSRYAIDGEVAWGPVTTFAEYIHQSGRSVTDFPLSGSPSNDNRYWWAGVEVHWDAWSLRYNFSWGDYRQDDIRETIHQPGIVYTVNDHLKLLLEYDHWRRGEPGANETVDNSLNFVIDAHF